MLLLVPIDVVFHEDGIEENAVKEIETSKEFGRLVTCLPYGHLKKEKKDVFHGNSLLCILLSNLPGHILMFLITSSCF